MSGEYYRTTETLNRLDRVDPQLRRGAEAGAGALDTVVPRSLRLGCGLPAHGGVERLHGERRRRVDVAIRVHVGLLRARVGARVLHARLHVHHLHRQVVELLLRRHAVAVQPVLADDRVRVQVGRHARPGRRHLHVLHWAQVTCEWTAAC